MDHQDNPTQTTIVANLSAIWHEWYNIACTALPATHLRANYKRPKHQEDTSVSIWIACIAMMGWDTSKHFVEFKIVQSLYQAFNDNDVTQEGHQAAIKVFDKIREALSSNTMCRPSATCFGSR